MSHPNIQIPISISKSSKKLDFGHLKSRNCVIITFLNFSAGVGEGGGEAHEALWRGLHVAGHEVWLGAEAGGDVVAGPGVPGVPPGPGLSVRALGVLGRGGRVPGPGA